MTYLTEMDGVLGFMPLETGKHKGQELQSAYNDATPFPHIVIDDFLPPELLEQALANFPTSSSGEDTQFDRAQERLKTQFSPEDLTPRLRTMFYAFNSRPFIRVLENITGIKGLIPDPYFMGAGFHEILTGGHLSVHADFNHHKPMDLERRINVLIYLNRDWTGDFGGQLELWSKDMKSAVHKVDPIFNRCVIFNTNSDSYHGNPAVVSHPQGLSRKSIALYYYTATWSSSKRDHTTQFRVRTGTEDSRDWKVELSELVADLLPPRLYRGLKKLKR